MSFHPQTGLTHVLKTLTTRRHHARLRQDTLRSSLGPVVDISVGGACILTRRAPRGLIELELRDADDRLTVAAQVMWTRRVGLLTREVGLRFLDLTPAITRRITRMAGDNNVRCHLGD